MAIGVLNTRNTYQGQLKASSTPDGIFTSNTDYFNLLNEMTQGTLSYITRIGIYWDKILLKYPNQNPCVLLRAKNSPDNVWESFELGTTGVLEIRDVQINGIKFTQNSTPSCFIDYIGVELQ